MRLILAILASCLGLLAACGHVPPAAPGSARGDPAGPTKPVRPAVAVLPDSRGHEIVMFALGLVDTGYRFGGKNPAAGLDCSGMVSYVYKQAAGIPLSGSAADMARQGRFVDRDQARPGDLVFFNTRNKSYSHVGIYLGDGRFVHAPNSNGKVRTDHLTSGWFSTRFEEARTYLD